MVTEDSLTLSGGHTMQYTGRVSHKCTLEACTILLTDVAPISLIRNIRTVAF